MTNEKVVAKDFELWMEQGNGRFYFDQEQANIIINALEKQIPKKPTIVGRHYVCANCNTWILFDDEIPNKTDAYCFYCGQAILWPENHSETSQDFNLDNIAKGLKKLRDPK